MSTPPPGPADHDYCRRALPQVSRTFALNIRLLAGDFQDSVRTAYLLCRAADALEDSWGGDAAEIGRAFDRLRAALDGSTAEAEALAEAAAARAGGRADLMLVARLPAVLRVFGALAPADRAAAREALEVMTAGMRRYACRAAARGDRVPYLDDEGELHDYCWVVAGCVGVMLTRMFSARRPARDAREEARRWELAPVVGESLQLTNILLDWPIDVRRGRCYLPAAWLAGHGLAPVDLVGHESPGVREVETRLEGLARRALGRVPEYLDTLPRSALRYRLFVLWPTLWAARSLDHARRDPEFPWGLRRPRLPRGELWGTALAALLAPGVARELRRA